MRTERSYGSFYRAIRPPDGIEEEKVAAKFKGSVLEITVPVTGREGGRRIKVES
jgi:HSP20 family protein